ncbi:protein kinase, putative, partial [Bodo saltans]
MELSPQGSLTTVSRTLQRLRHLDPASHMKLMLSYSVQIASGLQHLHSKRMLHLDLKPDNILCFVENRVKLCDFGTSKNLTRTDTVASGRCTVQYAAPEVLIEEDMECDGRVLPAPKSPNTVSVATDLYSLGSVLCELFSGKAPWGDRNHFSICAAISRGASPNILQHPWPSNCPQ